MLPCKSSYFTFLHILLNSISFFWLLLGVVLYLQETLDNCGLFLSTRVDSLFSPQAFSYPSVLPDSWCVRPWAASLASVPVCSGANAVGPRSGPWPGLPGMSAVQERFPKSFSPKLTLVAVLHCWKQSFFSHLGGSFQLFSTLLLAFFNLALDFEVGFLASLCMSIPGSLGVSNMVVSRVISQ